MHQAIYDWTKLTSNAFLKLNVVLIKSTSNFTRIRQWEYCPRYILRSVFDRSINRDFVPLAVARITHRTLELRVSSMQDLYYGIFNSANEITGIEISAERLNYIKSDLLVKYAISNVNSRIFLLAYFVCIRNLFRIYKNIKFIHSRRGIDENDKAITNRMISKAFIVYSPYFSCLYPSFRISFCFPFFRRKYLRLSEYNTKNPFFRPYIKFRVWRYFYLPLLHSASWLY